mgnify:CR=1 FL=1
MMRAEYSEVMWDWNGTLFDDAWLCVEAMNGLLRCRGLPELTPERYADIFDFPVERYYRRLGFDWSRETFEAVGLEFMRVYEARRLECRLRLGAVEALARWRRRGARQHLISGYRQDTLDELVARYGVREWFDDVVGAEDVFARGKLDLGARWREARGAGAGPRLVIGDTVHDFEMARVIGADCVLLPCGHNSLRRLAACGTTLRSSLDEL